MANGNKILSYDKLREYAGEFGEDASTRIRRFWARSRAKTHVPTFWQRIWPRAEVLRLRAFIGNMREEEHLAAKNALDLYAENELLRQYKTLAQRGPSAFYTTEQYGLIKKEAAMWRDKCDSIERALCKMHDEWTEYIKKHD